MKVTRNPLKTKHPQQDSCGCSHPHKRCRFQAPVVGYLHMLPNELIFKIFHLTSAEDLSRVSITSVTLSQLVRSYISCNNGLRHFLTKYILLLKDRNKDDKDIRLWDLFKRLGLLLKRSTFLLPTRERLMMMGRFVTKVYAILQLEVLQNLQCFGHLYGKFTRGWSEKECRLAFLTVMEYFKIKPKLVAVLSSSPGTFPKAEYETRCLLRHVFLTGYTQVYDLQTYLDLILKPYPLVHQAKILYLLYGPADSKRGVIGWYQMSEALLDARRSMHHFSGMAIALKSLYSHPAWTEGSVNSVLKELSDCPQEWTTLNMAKLLILCGEDICFNFLVSIALNGKMREVANIFVTLSMIIKEEDLQMKWLLNLVYKVCRALKNTHDVHSLLNAIPELYKDLTVELQEVPDAENYLNFADLAESQAELLRELLHHSYKMNRLSL
ncbi:F-box only protein 47 [Holothuria leucospilota]|uniref:F-box only protein 47 n=1 Tax=Holothuria leucospilota TaxID=206669 RepID=A0A9Q0YR76_HOLLE|nr:F-box only protein 47 [Holothuria leucospilota]